MTGAAASLPKTRVWGFDLPDHSDAPGEPPVLAAFRIWPGAGVTTTTRRGVPDYLRARYYDPSTAQFISRDPMVSTTRQPYAYTSDNPLNHTDASGLWFGIDDLVATGVGALVGAGASVVVQQVTTGHIDLAKVGIDAAAGAVGGEATLYLGPIAGGAIAGGLDDAATQVYQHHGFNNFSPGELAFDTAAGGVVGKFGDVLTNELGATGPGYRFAMGCLQKSGGHFGPGGFIAGISSPLATGLGAGYGVGIDALHRAAFGE